MSSLTTNLQQIYDIKLQIKDVIGTESDLFEEYPDLIETAIEQGGGSGLDWDDVAQAGYIIPAGTITPSQFGIYDVADYAYADTRGLQPSGSYSISENGNYNVSTYATVNVSVSGGSGSTYSIVSGYVFDTMNMTLGYMNDGGSYLTYTLTLDSMTPSVSLGEALSISGNYDAFTSIGLGLGSVEGNGTYNTTGYTPVNESSGWSEFNISNVLVEQPNVSIDFNVKLYKDQTLYGFPYDIEYTVSGYVPLVISSMSYSLDGGMVYNSMNYDSLNNSYSTDFGGMNIMAPSSQGVIVKAEYNNSGTVKYLSASIGMADYGSPVMMSGSWALDTMVGQVYFDNMTGSTDKTITTFTVNGNANVTVEYTDSVQPVVTDKLRLEFMTAGVTNILELDDDSTTSQQVTIDAGTVSFVDVASGNSLYPETSQTISTQAAMAEFEVVVTANPGTVTVQDTGIYDVYAYKGTGGNWIVNFTPNVPSGATVTDVYSQGTSSDTHFVDQGDGTWLEENVRDAYVPGRVLYEVYSDNTSESFQVDYYDSANETLYFVIGNQRDYSNQYGEAGWNWLWDTNSKTLSHVV